MADGGDSPFIDGPRICVDFGTALSKASICLDPDMPLEQGVRALPLGKVSGAEHPLLTPSVLLVSNGRLFFGPMAFEHAQQSGETENEALLSFKTVLGAENVAQALAAKIGPTLDPTGTFKQRDALVLYLAYLDQLIRAALIISTPDFPYDPSYARRRYTSPVWRAGASVDHEFEAVFNEAAAVSQRLGRLFLAPEGISIAQCKDALDRAAIAPGDGRLESGVFEPHAAAAASLAFTSTPSNFVFVLDMGAGTTDFAAFEFNEHSDPPMMDEIKEARQCSLLAGDAIDRALAAFHLRKSGTSQSVQEDEHYLRAVRLKARLAKEALFSTGKCTLSHKGKSTQIRLQDLAEDEGFRQLQAEILDVITTSLSPVLQRAHNARARVVDIVLAGGGARLPFLPQLIEEASRNRLGSTSIRISLLGPPNPDYDTIDASLGDVFPQIAMSIGGAIVEIAR
ncbi:MAG: Hsp70 family protein [Caulobacterales bacterium]